MTSPRAVVHRDPALVLIEAYKTPPPNVLCCELCEARFYFSDNVRIFVSQAMAEHAEKAHPNVG